MYLVKAFKAHFLLINIQCEENTCTNMELHVCVMHMNDV